MINNNSSSDTEIHASSVAVVPQLAAPTAMDVSSATSSLDMNWDSVDEKLNMILNGTISDISAPVFNQVPVPTGKDSVTLF
jgi:hypothetical protein